MNSNTPYDTAHPMRMRSAPLHSEINYIDFEIAKRAIVPAFNKTVEYLGSLNPTGLLIGSQNILNAAKKTPESIFDVLYQEAKNNSNDVELLVSNFPFSETWPLSDYRGDPNGNIVTNAHELRIKKDELNNGVKIIGSGNIQITDSNNWVIYITQDERPYVDNIIIDEFGLNISEVHDDFSAIDGEIYKITQDKQQNGWALSGLYADTTLDFAITMFAKIFTLKYTESCMSEFLSDPNNKKSFGDFSKLMMPSPNA